MNKIEKVSIGGYAFSLDKEAYDTLQEYLEELKKHYAYSSDGKEILEGIEERIAEILFEKSKQNGIVTVEYVKSAIEVLGNPTQIDEEENTEPSKKYHQQEKPVKHLYRDTVNKVFGGVCSGLAAYFNLDIALMRIIWVVMVFLGIHISEKTNLDFMISLIFIIYLILWISIPAARTVKQRLEMRGEDASAEGIRKDIESGARKVKEAALQAGRSGIWSTIVNIFVAVMAVILIIVGATGLFAGTLAFFGEHIINIVINHSDWTNWMGHIPVFTSLVTNVWAKILLSIAYFIPFIGMIYGGVMILFRFKSPSWRPGLWLFVFWLLSVIALAIVAGFFLAEHFLSI